MSNDNDKNSVETFDLFYTKIETLSSRNYKTGYNM